MRVVYPELNLEPFVPEPEKHTGWVWLVKVREGDEEAEDAWISENPRDSINRSLAKYPNAKLVSCHRREEVTNHSMFRCFLDGSLLGF